MPEEVLIPNAEERPDAITSRRLRRANRHWSGLPLAASLALVAFAVLFGIYGPRVVDRSNPPIGIPAWELADAALERHMERHAMAVHETPASIETVEAEATGVLGQPANVPDLSQFGFVVYPIRQVALPGAGRAVIVLYGRTGLVQPTFLSLVLVPDREQYVVYSPFGKPTYLPKGDVYPVGNSDGIPGPSEAFVWTDGSLVRVLLSLDGSALDEVSDAIIRPSLAKISGSFDEPTDSR